MASSAVRLARLAAVVVVLSVFPSAILAASSHEDPNLPAETPSPTLLFVAELCRHGDRTPLYEFPSDALPASRWPEGVGQLTAIGQRAHYNLGLSLRERYVQSGFLSSSYNHQQLHVRSSDVDRTLMSATSQLVGLFPPGTAQNSDVRVNFGRDALRDDEGGLPHLFQGVPIHTRPRNFDSLLIPGADCPAHDQLYHAKLSSATYLDKQESERDFLSALTAIAGLSEQISLNEVEHLSDTWTCFHAHSVPLPADATPDIVEHARNISDWFLTFSNDGLPANRFRSGLVLNIVREHMAMAALDADNSLPASLNDEFHKFLFLSAHDSTVAAALAAMRVFDGKYPPYNSTLIWELYKSYRGDLFVRVEYNGQRLLLPGCSDVDCAVHEYMSSTMKATVFGEVARRIECLPTWRRFLTKVTNLFHHAPSDPARAALSTFGNIKPPNPADASVFPVIGFVAGITFIVAVAALFIWWRTRSRYHGYVPADNNDLASTPKQASKEYASTRILL